ncbi:hypothetical protein GBAR_LOCUS1183 [Geodia barretti]|uniref:Uncharacterized protein n=1 Tax=Geodia barretti TaxID=519541 RepID=A0AA35QW90_GEOBA|nr:hypothetical protein GBAR_LOCUS1183 [Geodia barretti]
MLYCHFNFEFFIIQNLSALAKRVEDQISKRVKGNYERGPISNFKFQEDEVSLEIQESCGNGWNMKELTPLEVLLYYVCLRILHYFADDLQVFKRDVDRFSARKELCTCQVKVWCENEEAPKYLLRE